MWGIGVSLPLLNPLTMDWRYMDLWPTSPQHCMAVSAGSLCNHWASLMQINQKRFWYCLLRLRRGIHLTTPAGGVVSAHLQKVRLQLLNIILEALDKWADQTCCAAFIFHQLYSISWKRGVLYTACKITGELCYRSMYLPMILVLAWTNILRASFLSSTVSRRRRKLYAPLSLTVEYLS